MVFSNTSTLNGILEQTRDLMRVDANQWATQKVVNSANNYLDVVTGYAIGADRRFQFDDTNHTALPIGTTNLVASQADYSFLTDQQSNTILNLTRIDILDDSGLYRQLRPIDKAQLDGIALDEWNKTDDKPIYYDKIADNIIRLYPTPAVSVTAGLKFYFQRTPSYFVAADTTKAPGVPPLLHRGFVVACAYDGALSLGLKNLSSLGAEMQREQLKMEEYFTHRETDEPNRITMRNINPR